MARLTGLVAAIRTDLASHLLMTAACLALVLSIVAGAHSFSLGLSPLVPWKVGDAATACAGFGTIAAVFFALYQFSRSLVVSRSKFALDMSMDGVRRAFDVITASQQANNVAWVMGARLLLRAEKMQLSVTEPDHRAAWELFKEEWRIKFHTLVSMPAEYYFGLLAGVTFDNDTDYTDERLRAMMANSTSSPQLSMTNRSGTSFRDSHISLRALKVIFDFTAFPDDYQETDLMKGRSGFSEIDRERLDMQNLWGLYAYIHAKDRWLAIDGKVHDKQPKGATPIELRIQT